MNKSKIEKRQAGAEADSSTKAEVTNVSQTIAKPHVVRCPSCGSEDEYSQGFKQNIQPVDNGEWRQVCFNICDRCRYAIDVWFWD